MAEIIFGILITVFFLFIAWLVCCCWWLSDKETLADRIIKITKQFGRMKWFVIYVVIVLGIWGGAMIKALYQKCPKQECPTIDCTTKLLCPKVDSPYEQEYQQLRTKVKNFCREHKRASICK